MAVRQTPQVINNATYTQVATGFTWGSVQNNGSDRVYVVVSDTDPGPGFGAPTIVDPGSKGNFTEITGLGLWAKTESLPSSKIVVDGA